MRVVRERLSMVLGALGVVALLVPAGVHGHVATALAAAPVSHTSLSDPVYYLTITATAPYGYQPDTVANLPLNTMINVTFIDDTPLQHSFNISSREGVEIVNYTTTTAEELNRILFSAPALYATIANGPGEKTEGEFLSPATPGWYEFICNVTGHFQMGMFGYIAFGEALPTNLTLPSGTGAGSGIGLPPVADVGIALAAILVVLGVVLLRLRRIARDRAMEESDKASPVLPRPPSPP